MSAEYRRYAAPAIREPLGRRHTYLIFYGSTPWMRYVWYRGIMGDEARWQMRFTDRMQARHNRREDRKPWKRLHLPTTMVTVNVGPLCQFAGWLLSMYIFGRMLRNVR